MKTILSILFFGFIANIAFGQNYHRLFNNSSWIYAAGTTSPTNYNIPIGVDTVINGQSCTILNRSVFREDTLTRSVYKRYHIDSTEFLLFDFSLTQGQQIILKNGLNYTVDTTYNVPVAGGTRKYIRLSPPLSPYYALSEEWIEGVGSINAHPLSGNHEMRLGIINCSIAMLLCSYQNNQMVYNWGLAHNQGLSDCFLSNEINKTQLSAINLFPNPAHSKVTVEYADYHHKQIIITNALGMQQKVLSLQNNTTEIDITTLANGIYFVGLYENNTLLSYKKLVVQH